MICKLCLQEKPLLKKSHIIPNFMYRELFDDNHKFIKGDLKNMKARTVQTGEFEADILCADCDNGIIGGLESYAKKVLYGGDLPGVTMRNEVSLERRGYTYVGGLDYKKFKLFLLSLIWRCSISERDFYRQVDLGPYEGKIQKMIYEGDPGGQGDFPCVISSYRLTTTIPPQIMSQPTKHRQSGGVIAYAMMMAGIVYLFLISPNKRDATILNTAINEKGELRMPHIAPEDAGQLLKHFSGNRLTI